jgi:hypothetical protein
VKIAAINNDPTSIYFIKNSDYDLQLLAIQKDYKCARMIKNIHPDILTLAILMGYTEKNGYVGFGKRY